MKARITAILMLTVLLLSLFTACGEKKETVITQDQAYAIVLKDLGIDAEDADSPHFHVGTHDGLVCYNFYLTVDGETLYYTISTSGEILEKGHGTHSH